MSGPWEKYSDGPWSKFSQEKTEPAKLGPDAMGDSLREVLRGTDWGTRNIAGAGTALSNLWEGTKQLVGQGNQTNIANNRIIRDEAPLGGFVGDVAMTAVPFGMAGNSVKAAGAVGAGYGLTQPVDNATSFGDIAKGKAINTVLSGLAGSGGQALANKALSGVSGSLSKIEQKVQEKAAQVAASDTASARSAAGNAAQDAYRQLEHIRELGSYRALTAEEAMIANKLEQELAGKAVDKLLPAAAKKQATSEAYVEAMKTEADRATKYAAEKLSKKEAKDQMMARLKRYGPAAAGGIVGNMLIPGMGGAVGGAATGLVLRPAIRSMMNLSKNPAVQHGLLSPFENSPMFTSQALPIMSLLAAEGALGQ
jgi:hypothetical protein